jgi:molecular chaperone DnaK (HSP70)
VLAQTVAVTTATLRGAGPIAGLFLVGGSTRVPVVASMLHRATGIAPTVIEQPELVVAEGALYASGATVADPVTPSTTGAAGGFYGGWRNTPGETISYWVQLVVTKPISYTSEKVTWSTTCTTVA